MPLLRTIEDDLKTAMRAKDDVARETLRMMKTDLVAREVELGKPLDDAEEITVLSRAVKTRRDAAEQYTQGGRADLASKEHAEIAIIERYLPSAMSEDEARVAVRSIVSELGVSSKKEMGKVVKLVLERHRGRIDGKLASRLAGEALT